MKECVGNENHRMIMLQKNEIPGILRPETQYLDGIAGFGYDTEGLISLAQWCKTRELREGDLQWILQGMLNIWKEGDAYLLAPGSFCLLPDQIWLEPGKRQVKLCVRQRGECDWQKAMQELGRFLLEAIDYKEEECVKLAYEFYHISRKETLIPMDFQELLFNRNYTVITEEPELERSTRYDHWIRVEASRMELNQKESRELRKKEERKKQRFREILAGLAAILILFALYQSGF
ncbi:MAG: hypothetical protein HFI93_08425 [Lachnospiraceae bacterium]|nr:hypothetical protein [Lachnospiraceae bacterium]